MPFCRMINSPEIDRVAEDISVNDLVDIYLISEYFPTQNIGAFYRLRDKLGVFRDRLELAIRQKFCIFQKAFEEMSQYPLRNFISKYQTAMQEYKERKNIFPAIHLNPIFLFYSKMFDQTILDTLTRFYRYPKGLTSLQELIPEKIKVKLKAQEKLRIKFIGCSSGEEVYTFLIEAMGWYELQGINLAELQDHLEIQTYDKNPWDPATATYPAFALNEIPEDKLNILRQRGLIAEQNGCFSFSKEFNSLIKFTQANLLEPGQSGPQELLLQPADLVVCLKIFPYIFNQPGFTPEQEKLISGLIGGDNLLLDGCLVIDAPELLYKRLPNPEKFHQYSRKLFSYCVEDSENLAIYLKKSYYH